MQDLEALRTYIAEQWPFDEAGYPALTGMDAEQRRLFEIRHLALHFAKTSGKVVAVSEAADHGEGLNLEELRMNIAKSLVNTLRLAEVAGLSAKDLADRVKAMYESG